jgi:uncharacterized repeat protein (TIGR01451 family)
VTGQPPIGPPVNGESSAKVDVIHPAVKIVKDVSPTQARPGETVKFTVTVTNTGDVPLSDVVVTDDKTPACDFRVETLAAGASQHSECTLVVQQDVTNVAGVTGNDPTGRPVTSKDDAAVDVIGPGITVTKTGPAKPVLPGQKATFTVVVKNTGDVTLTDVVLEDAVAPGCAVKVGTLKPDEAAAPVTCEVTMADADVTNTVKATGTDPVGKPVTSVADAVAKVAKPGIDVVKTADPTIQPGGTITYTIKVTNTGNVDLAPVEVLDNTAMACDRAFERLTPGAHQEWTCTAKAPQSGQIENIATATGTPDTEQPGPPVRDTDRAVVKVAAPPTPTTPDTPTTPSLPNTGYNPWAPGVTGLALLSAGVLLLLTTRHLRRR